MYKLFNDYFLKPKGFQKSQDGVHHSELRAIRNILLQKNDRATAARALYQETDLPFFVTLMFGHFFDIRFFLAFFSNEYLNFKKKTIITKFEVDHFS